jgi:plasmid stabilization system protein ParE
MTTYNIHFTQKADDDILRLYYHIAYELAMPDTAFKYFQGLFAAIEKLRITGASYAFSQRESLKIKYGAYVRSVNYKKMTIVYDIGNDIILIRRIMPSSMIL